MYVGIGPPKVILLGGKGQSPDDTKGARPLMIRKSPDDVMFLCVYENCVEIWWMKPRICMWRVRASTSSLLQYGTFIRGEWKFDRSCMVIVTAFGYLHIYQVNVEDENGSNKLLAFDREELGFEWKVWKDRHSGISDNMDFQDEFWMSGAGEGRGIPMSSIKLKSIIRVGEGTSKIASLVAYRSDIYVSTKDGMIQTLSWHGQTDSKPGRALRSMSFLSEKRLIVDEHGLYVKEMIYSKIMGLFGWILSNGEAYLVYKKYEGRVPSPMPLLDTTSDDNDVPEWKGHILIPFPTDQAECAMTIAFNSVFRLAAVGYASGNIALFSIGETAQKLPTFSHRFNIESIRRFNELSIMKDDNLVHTAEWTSDGYALLVGYGSGGMALWSVFGNILMSIIQPYQNLSPLPEEKIDSNIHLLRNCVISAFWGPENSELFILSEVPSHQKFVFFSLAFARSASITNPTQSNLAMPLLQLDDCIIMHSDKLNHTGMLDREVLHWPHFSFPSVYLADNWPIKYVAVNEYGMHIAVAGKKGFAMYNGLQRRWKLFVNQQQEQAFSCRGGLTWLLDYLIVACQDLRTFQFNLWVFSLDKSLDISNLLLESKVDRPVHLMDSYRNILVVYTLDNILTKYRLEFVDRVLKLIPIKCVSLSEFINNPWTVQSIRFPFKVNEPYDDGENSPTNLLVLNLGNLHHLTFVNSVQQANLTRDPPLCRLLSDKVENFWHVDIGQLCHRYIAQSLWAAVPGGVKIWFNNSFYQNEQSYFARLDFYPLAVRVEKGIITGINHFMSMVNAIKLPFAKPESLSKIFVHFVLRMLIRNDNLDVARHVMEYYQQLPYFEYILELLIHEVLDSNIVYVDSEHNELIKIAKFIENLECFPDVIMRCARKTEADFWNRLFSSIGSARQLFERCIKEKKYKVAASYIPILHTVEPLPVSTLDSLLLVEVGLKERDYELCAELFRFIRSTGIETEIERRQGNFLTNGSLEKSEIVEKSKGNFLRSLLINEARSLLKSYEIRSLGSIVKLLDISMISLFESEHDLARSIENPSLAFKSLHAQFEWPYPPSHLFGIFFSIELDIKDIAHFFELFESLRSAQLPQKPEILIDPLENRIQPLHYSLKSGLLEDLYGSKSLRQQKVNELRYLLNIMLTAKCYAWSLLLASLLLDKKCLLFLIQQEPSLNQLFHIICVDSNQECECYRQLYEVVQSRIAILVTE